MNYAAIKKHDVANGPGIRVSLFVSGCEHYCKGCFNSEAWDFSYGAPFDASAEAELFEALGRSYIKGFSLLGGEPFHPKNRPVLADLLEKIKEKFPEKDVWCYTGYNFEELCDESLARRMLENIDILVDGRFIEEKKNLSLRFRGSENQRILRMPETLASGSPVFWEN